MRWPSAATIWECRSIASSSIACINVSPRSPITRRGCATTRSRRWRGKSSRRAARRARLRTKVRIVRLLLACIFSVVSAFGQTVNVAVVHHDGGPDDLRAFLVPAGSFDGEKWKQPGARLPVKKWSLWAPGINGLTLTVSGRCPEDTSWLTNLREKKPDPHLTAFGTAVSPPPPVALFEERNKDQAERSTILDLLKPKLSGDRSSRIALENLNVARMPHPAADHILRSVAPE